MPVNFNVDGFIGTVLIDRQNRLNALDLDAFHTIEKAVETANSDKSIRGLIFMAAGDRAFSAGADINDLTGLGPEEASKRATYRRFVLQGLSEAKVPSVAVVDGLAMGGGVELAMACTFRLATERATFSFPEIKLGLLPGAGATQRLPRLVGTPRALEMMLTARPVTAEEAVRIGLIDRIVRDPVAEPRAFVEQWIPFSRSAIAGIMAAARHAELPIREGLVKEGEELALLNMSPDGLEGVAAFLEKRPAVFNRD
ncbi:enoyl-CoA hydratase/isomerase family protein [Mesorhizobium sp. 43Arga]